MLLSFQWLYSVLSFLNPPTPTPLPGPFPTHDIKRVDHRILADHPNSDMGSPEKLYSASPLWFSFTSTMAHILGRQPRWWSSLVFPGLHCSFLATPFIGSAVSPRPPRRTRSRSRRSFRVTWRQPALQQQMQTTIQLVLNHEFSYLHIHLFKDNIHTSRVIIKSLYCFFAGTEWLE